MPGMPTMPKKPAMQWLTDMSKTKQKDNNVQKALPIGEDEKITNCTVYFWRCDDFMKLSKNERAGNANPDETKIYGFDWMRNEYIGKNGIYGYYLKKYDADNKPINEKDPNAKDSDLEKEYNPIPIEWKKKEKYYTPWLSIAEGQTVRLKITMDWNSKPTELKWDENYSYPGKLELPNAKKIQIKKGIFSAYQDIKIKCIAPIKEEIEIRLLADNKLAGKLRIVPNKKRTVKVTWCLVDLSGKNSKGNYIDIEALKDKLTQQQIKRFVKYLGLSQALVDVEATKAYQTLNLSDLHHTWDEFTKKKGYEYNGNGIIEVDKLFKLTQTEYEKKYRNDNNDLVIFLYNNYVPKTETVKKIITEVPDQRIQGRAFNLGSKYCGLFEGFQRNYNTVVHELLHCLGLLHSFDIEAKHKFKAYETDNFMDYASSDERDDRSMLWKWQWEKIWKYLDRK